MRTVTRRMVEGLAVVGGAVMLRPGTRANRAVRHQADGLGHHLRHLAGRLHGMIYRLRGRHPDPHVSGNVLADRIRSSLGPLEKRLDLPHIDVMAEGQIALLHGAVGTEAEAADVEAAVGAVSGVLGVESYLYVGLGGGDTRPSAGRAVEQTSEARQVSIAPSHRPWFAPSSAAFAERLPDDERAQVVTHLPADVRSMFTPPRRIRAIAPARTTSELVGRIAAATETAPEERALEVTRAVVRELRALVPDEAAGVSAVLPTTLRDLWDEQ